MPASTSTVRPGSAVSVRGPLNSRVQGFLERQQMYAAKTGTRVSHLRQPPASGQGRSQGGAAASRWYKDRAMSLSIERSRGGHAKSRSVEVPLVVGASQHRTAGSLPGLRGSVTARPNTPLRNSTGAAVTTTGTKTKSAGPAASQASPWVLAVTKDRIGSLGMVRAGPSDTSGARVTPRDRTTINGGHPANGGNAGSTSTRVRRGSGRHTRTKTYPPESPPKAPHFGVQQDGVVPGAQSVSAFPSSVILHARAMAQSRGQNVGPSAAVQMPHARQPHPPNTRADAISHRTASISAKADALTDRVNNAIATIGGPARVGAANTRSDAHAVSAAPPASSLVRSTRRASPTSVGQKDPSVQPSQKPSRNDAETNSNVMPASGEWSNTTSYDEGSSRDSGQEIPCGTNATTHATTAIRTPLGAQERLLMQRRTAVSQAPQLGKAPHPPRVKNGFRDGGQPVTSNTAVDTKTQNPEKANADGNNLDIKKHGGVNVAPGTGGPQQPVSGSAHAETDVSSRKAGPSSSAQHSSQAIEKSTTENATDETSTSHHSPRPLRRCLSARSRFDRPRKPHHAKSGGMRRRVSWSSAPNEIEFTHSAREYDRTSWEERWPSSPSPVSPSPLSDESDTDSSSSDDDDDGESD